MANLTSDIYDVVASVEEVKKDYIDEDEETLSVGIYGYLGAIESRKIQSSIIIGSELANESFPQRAKYDQNLITHAINCNLEDINAVPSTVPVLIGLVGSDVDDNINEADNTFVLDRESSIIIAGKEFHPVYDIMIRKTTINNTSVYSAQYVITYEDPNINLNSPYLASPYIQIINNETYLFISCLLTQLHFENHYASIISNNLIENKVFTFTFTNQLSYFEVFVKDSNGQETFVTPIFEGSAVPTGITNYCYYTYINTSTIRVKFTRSSFRPTLNDQITVNIYTTDGNGGNFKYKSDTYGTLESTRYNYSNVDYLLKPLSDPSNGSNRKSKDELKLLLPKEAFARGIISTNYDLDNYFNMINTSFNNIKTQRKVDNQTERTFYTYMVMKDSNNDIVPTNTLPLLIDLDNLSVQKLQEDERLLLPAGTVFGYNNKTGVAYVYDTESNGGAAVVTLDNDADDDDEIIVSGDDEYYVFNSDYGNLNDPSNFVYISPFNIIINKSPLYMQYLLTKINIDPYLAFTFINLNSTISFIGSSLHWERLFYTNRNIYNMSMTISQNISKDFGLVVLDELVDPDDEEDVQEDETVDLLAQKLNAIYYKDNTDYSKCYGKYFYSKENIDTNNSIANASVGTIYESVDALIKGEASHLNNTNYWVYTVVNNMPVKIGNINVSMVDHEYTPSCYSFRHNLTNNDMVNTIFGKYFVFGEKVNTIDTLNSISTNYGITFYTTVQNAIKEEKLTGLLYVYTQLDNGDILNIGSINAVEVDKHYEYSWVSSSCLYTESDNDRYTQYTVLDTGYNVWNFGDNELKWSPTLQQAINNEELPTGNYFAYICDKNSHPIMLGEIYVESGKDTSFYYSTVAFVSVYDISSTMFDNYFTTYKLSPTKLKDLSVVGEEYYTSLFDVIYKTKPDSGSYYVYTIKSGIAALIGQITLAKTTIDSVDYYKYAWESYQEYQVFNNMKVIALFYRDGSPYRYEELLLNIDDSDTDTFNYNWETHLTTDDTLDLENNIKIFDTYLPKYSDRGDGYFNGTTKCDIYVFAKIKDENGDVIVYPYSGGYVPNYPGFDPALYFPAIDTTNYTLTNIYSVNKGVELYTSYGNITKSVVTPIESSTIADKTASYKITSVPLIGYRYSMDEDHITEVVDSMNLKKAYLDHCLSTLENTMEIDFKFFNTFGPSKMYTIDGESTYINRVNVSLVFALRLLNSNDSNTASYIKKDVKTYIEDLDEINSVHISRLVTQINSDYENSISYFDFLGFNDYDLAVLHMYKDEDNTMDITTPPEFINIHNIWNEITQKYEPDITINIIE